MTDEDLRGFLLSCLEGLGVTLPPGTDLPVALLRAVLERLRALDEIQVDQDELRPLPWAEEGPWIFSR